MFGYATSVRAAQVQDCASPEEFKKILSQPAVGEVCAELRDLLEQRRRGGLSATEYEQQKSAAKRRLPVFTFQARFGGRARRSLNAQPTGLAIYDKDHVPCPEEYWKEKRALLAAKKLLRGCVALAHVTPSSEGLRIVFRIPAQLGTDIAAAQRWMASVLGDTKFDQACKDLARCSFAVPTDYVLYEDDAVLFGEAGSNAGLDGRPPCGTHPAEGDNAQAATPPAAGASLVGARTPERRTEAADSEIRNEGMSGLGNPDGQGGAAGVGNSPNSPILDKKEDRGTFPADYDGTPYTLIVSRLTEQLGGVPAHGSRNNFIFTLACHLRYVCDNNPAWIKSIIPTFGELRGKVEATVDSACSREQSPMIPAIVKRALLLARQDALDGDEDTESQPPAMPAELPPLIELLLQCTPDIYRPAVAHAVFPALGAHLWKTQFRYIDNKLHETTLMNVLMAGTGAGKDCISDPIDYIMADIREQDRKNMQREREWKDEVNTKGANKDKRKRPEGLVIQEVDPDMTNPAFVMRMAEADGHFLYVKMNELDQFDALRGNGRGGQQFRIMCLAFDPNNQYGQTRVGTQSVTERVKVRFNWNAATTISKGQRYFRNVLTDGPISRINFCTIPEREIGADMPVYGTYPDDYAGRLRPYIQRLCEARGVVEVPEAARLARRLKDELQEFAVVSGSRTFENLSFRANVIAWLKGCVLYVAQGGQWDDRIEQFVRWSLKYDMWCKMRFFGAAIDEAEQTAPRSTRRGTENLLQQLPDEFTRDDLMNARLMNGMDRKGMKFMIYAWIKRNYIVRSTKVDSNSYRKLKFRHDGFDFTKDRA